MQSAHRQLALRSELNFGAGLPAKSEIRKDAVFPSLEDSPAWTVYLDDTTLIEKVGRAVAEKLEGLPPFEQAQLRTAYEWWGIPTNAAKAIERSRRAERLGAVLDGKNGVLRVDESGCLAPGSELSDKGRTSDLCRQGRAHPSVPEVPVFNPARCFPRDCSEP